MSFTAFDPRVLRVTSFCWVVQMLIVRCVHHWRILNRHSSWSVGYSITIRARWNARVIHTCRTWRRCHVAWNSTLMIAKKTRRWLLHSTWRVGEIHILCGSAFFIRGETRIEMCIKVLGLHFASTFFALCVRSSANKCSTLQLFINYNSSMLMNNAVRQNLWQVALLPEPRSFETTWNPNRS